MCQIQENSKYALMSVLCGSQTGFWGLKIPRLSVFSDQLHLIQLVNYVKAKENTKPL